jgi:hypothetical protein
VIFGSIREARLLACDEALLVCSVRIVLLWEMQALRRLADGLNILDKCLLK